MSQSRLLLIVLLYSSFAAISCDQVCYDNLGCFTNDYPFGGTAQRPISPLPESPAKIDTRFFLYTRASQDYEPITHSDLGQTFDARRETKLIIHGWFDSSFEVWILEMKRALLEVI